jgi:4-hydroxy-3-methylbut-2-enyl diphosphate reductase
MSIELRFEDVATAAAVGLEPSEVLVAREILGHDGVRIPCPAASLVWRTLRRNGVAARLDVVPLGPRDASVNSTLLFAGPPPGHDGPVGGAIVTRHDDPAAMRVGTAALRQVVATWRPRTVLLASPRSFCAGVERAIEIVERVLARGAPVYVRKQIVHNAHVVLALARKGAVFVEELDDVPDGATVIFSAHGVAPSVRAEAVERGLDVIDATCPLVTKVHAEARRFAQRGDTIVFIGHQGHEETEGTLGVAPDHTVLVQGVAEVATLDVPDPEHVSYLTQTTLAVDETVEVVDALRARFPSIKGPRWEDICYATTNRQDALRATVAAADLVLVVGSANSSNSQRLVELAKRQSKPAHLVNDAAAIELDWLAGVSTVGLTAGASAPAELVDGVIAALGGLGPLTVHEYRITTETVHFALPQKVTSHG